MCAFSQLCYEVLRKCWESSRGKNWELIHLRRFIEQQLSDRHCVDLGRCKVREDISLLLGNKAKW